MDIRPYQTLDRAQQSAVRAIYEQSFPLEERADFTEMERLAGAPNDARTPVFLAGLADGRVVGLCAGAYLARSRLGYLWYLAVHPEVRGRGLGRRLFEAGLAGLDARGVGIHGAPPRFHFWEVRRPEETCEAAERGVREARIRFYRSLGAQLLPVEYLCPPMAPGQPEIFYHLMACSRSADRVFSADDARAAALAGLIEGNGVAPDSRNVRLALESLAAFNRE